MQSQPNILIGFISIFILFASLWAFPAHAQVTTNWKTYTSIPKTGRLPPAQAQKTLPRQEPKLIKAPSEKPQLKVKPDGTKVIQKKFKLKRKNRNDGFWSNLFD